MRQRHRPSIRLSAALQAVVAEAGDSGPAIRALLILGAHAAGLATASLTRDCGELAVHPQVDPQVRAVLRTLDLSDTCQTPVRQVALRPVGGMDESPDLWAIGVEV